MTIRYWARRATIHCCYAAGFAYGLTCVLWRFFVMGESLDDIERDIR